MVLMFIKFLDIWLTNNNPLSMEIYNKECGIMRLNADGKQHIAQPPQPNSNKFIEKYISEKDSVKKTKTPLIMNHYKKEILPVDQDKIEKNKRIIFDEMSKNIKTIDLTK